MGTLEVVTTGTGVGVVVAVITFLAKNFPQWWRHRGEQTAAKAAAAAKSQEQAFTLLSQAAERLDKDVARLDKKSNSQQAQIDTQKTQIDTQQGQIEELRGSNTKLAEENRSFRRVILGVVSRLEIIAAWVRDGHHPPPPYTTEEILAYVREGAPHLWKDHT